jgi:hypothetical protein
MATKAIKNANLDQAKAELQQTRIAVPNTNPHRSNNRGHSYINSEEWGTSDKKM